MLLGLEYVALGGEGLATLDFGGPVEHLVNLRIKGERLVPNLIGHDGVIERYGDIVGAARPLVDVVPKRLLYEHGRHGPYPQLQEQHVVIQM